MQKLLNEIKQDVNNLMQEVSELKDVMETSPFEIKSKLEGVLGSTERVTELFGISGREEMTALEMLNTDETPYKSDDELEEERLVAKCDNAGIDDYHANRDNN